MWPFDLLRKREFRPDEELPFVRSPDGEAPVEVRSLEVRVVVTGLFAETTQTIVLFNPNRRPLEGNLTLPLSAGAVVCGYALDVEGQLVDGVVVPKEEARRILEAEIRKGVDPGLVEQVRGDVYRTRVYPIEPRGTRTVRITTISHLSVEGASAAYHLPLQHAEAVASVSLRVEVVQAPVEPVVSGALGNLSLSRWEDRFVAEAKLGAGRPAEDLQVRLPDLPSAFTTVERTADGEVFFCVSASAEAPAAAEPWSPDHISVAWDASGSRDATRDLELLSALLQRLGSVTVDLVVFRDEVEAPQTFTDTEALLAHLRSLPYDGATDLAGLDLSGGRGDAWLLFSDGLATSRRGLPTLGGIPVHTVCGSAASDSALLGHCSAETGGLSLDLVRTSPTAAVEALLAHTAAPRIAEARGCSEVGVRTLHGRLAVTGRLEGDAGSVSLAGVELAADLTASGASPGQTLARAWAGRRAQTLALLEGPKSAALLALARRYGLVTPGTSLLVLESLEQYLEHDVEPPRTLPTVRDAWLRRRAEKVEGEHQRRQAHIAVVLGWWQERIEWWETDFTPHHTARPRTDRRAKRSARGPGGAPPPPSAAPPPSPSLSRMAEPEMELSTLSMDLDEEEAADDTFSVGAPAPSEMAPAKAKADAGSRAASIAIQPWSADTPYLRAMETAADAYAAYLEQRPAFAASPAFFLDCGDFLLRAGQQALGMRVLSNLLELALGDVALLRMYAWRLQQAGALDATVRVLEDVLAIRTDEPQSHRDLALALVDRWERDGDVADACRAMELLLEVVVHPWERFPQIEVIALMELNRLVHLARAAGVPPLATIDPRMLRHLDLDVRISMSWDADLTDVDLHVFEPDGGHASYAHNRTRIGGLVSRDFTQGYGPEEYVLRRAMAGVYKIKAHYYGSHQQTLTGPCTVVVTVFTHYGRPQEQRQVLTLRLDSPSSEVVVGEVTIGAAVATEAPAASDWKTPFLALSRGMTVDEVTGALGQPASIRGSGNLALVYEPAPGVVVEVVLDPGLVAVQQLFDGARLDLL